MMTKFLISPLNSKRAMNARNGEEIPLYFRSLASALLTGFILAIIEIFLSPWRYFPENSFYIDLYIFRYNLHLYDIFFTHPLYLLGSFWVYLRSGKLMENLGKGISNTMLSMVTEEVFFFSLRGRPPCPSDPTAMIMGCILLDHSCIPIWWIPCIIPTFYILVYFRSRLKK
jgi:hypothetical protein